jgi:ABC-type transport system involved in cytochrome bd biosynthesis fused ATPase/permease subunit
LQTCDNAGIGKNVPAEDSSDEDRLRVINVNLTPFSTVATLLLAVMFITGFLGLKHAYGAGLLFIVATVFLGSALIRFAQEARISLHEYDEYQ